jgi:hypothetical protein
VQSAPGGALYTVALLRWLTDASAIELLRSVEMLNRAKTIAMGHGTAVLEKETFNCQGLTVTRKELARASTDRHERE